MFMLAHDLEFCALICMFGVFVRDFQFATSIIACKLNVLPLF